MQLKRPLDLFIELLKRDPDAARTENIMRCMQYAFRYYGYIDKQNVWCSDVFLSRDAYSIQSIDRALRDAKTELGMKDDLSIEQEHKYRLEHRSMNKTLPDAPQSRINDLDEEGVYEQLRSYFPDAIVEGEGNEQVDTTIVQKYKAQGLSGGELLRAVASEYAGRKI